MTPTKKPKLFSLPARYSSTTAALAFITSSTMASIAPESETCFKPRASMMASNLCVTFVYLLACPNRAEDLFGELVRQGVVLDFCQ